MKNEDVIRLIKEKIEGYRSELKVDEVGYVLQVGDGIAQLYGLDQAMVGRAFPCRMYEANERYPRTPRGGSAESSQGARRSSTRP